MKYSLKNTYNIHRNFNSKHNSNKIHLTTLDSLILSIYERRLESSIQKLVGNIDEGFFGVNMSTAGHEYENKIISSLKEAKISGNILEGAGSKASSADADMNIFGKIFNVEVKLNSDAQMGGSSIRFDESKGFSLATTLDKNVEELLLTIIESKRSDIEKLITFIREQPNELSGPKKFPISCKKSTWEKAQKNNLLINARVPLNAEFISEHYSKKDINYIQIGGAGLFYMKSNPAKLPIPKLEGNIEIEIRTGRSGSKKLKNLEERVIAAGIRIQGRLKTKNKSPYTLDDPESIRQLLDNSKKTF